jgi:hypothetical protein
MDSSTATIIEWRHSGHRLSYVRGIVDAAVTLGIEIQILTQASALDSNEYRVHLSDAPDLTVTTLPPESFTARKLPALLGSQRRTGRSVILPEVDRVLHAVVLAFLTRQLPRRTTIIAMRPPRWSQRKKWPASIVKVAVLRWLAATRSVSVLLLEDPLANQRLRVWRWPLGDSTLRLDDPADAPVESDELPPELGLLPENAKLIALTGMIDDRKQAPLILEGWALRPEDPECVLVIAGSQQSTVKRFLAENNCANRSDVVIVDRYLSREELAALINRSIALFVLFDSEFSSGTLLSAAQTGRWAITTAGGRPSKVAMKHRFGIETDLTPDGIRRSIDNALDKGATPEAIAVTGPAAFGDLVLMTTLNRPSIDQHHLRTTR